MSKFPFTAKLPVFSWNFILYSPFYSLKGLVNSRFENITYGLVLIKPGESTKYLSINKFHNNWSLKLVPVPSKINPMEFILVSVNFINFLLGTFSALKLLNNTLKPSNNDSPYFDKSMEPGQPASKHETVLESYNNFYKIS